VADYCHALVLTAGLGTRLRPLTLVRAKPAVPVAGEPLIRRIVRRLAAGGVTDVVLNLHHLPATLTAVLGDGSDLGVRARYSWEQPRLLGSAGGPRLALPLIGSETFLIVNGDTLSDVDLPALTRAHAASSALVMIAVTPNRAPNRYGGLVLDSHGHVTRVAPRGPAAEGSFHVVGFQAVHADAFSGLPIGKAVNSIGEAYDRLIAERPGSVAAFVCDASFWDIGSVEDYVTTSRGLRQLEDTRRSADEGDDVRVDPSARVRDCILWNDIEIGADCQLDECIVTDHVTVARGSTYRRAILLRTPDGVAATPLDQMPRT
jgi:NDP-sugar pyrophosphorylase family protein